MKLTRLLTALAIAAIAVPCAATRALAQKPDAELKGITVVGVVIEEMDSQALSCGFGQDAFEKAVSKALTDAGLKVVRNSDEDTYLYVRVNSLSLQTNVCVSRFDTTLYTHTTAKLSYGDQPVLVQVSLLHSGGLSGGGVNGHAESVLRSVRQTAEQFAARIRAAAR